MTDIRIIEGGKPSHEAAGELAERVKALVYEYADRMALATAIGVLHLVAYEITQDND